MKYARVSRMPSAATVRNETTHRAADAGSAENALRSALAYFGLAEGGEILELTCQTWQRKIIATRFPLTRQ